MPTVGYLFGAEFATINLSNVIGTKTGPSVFLKSIARVSGGQFLTRMFRPLFVLCYGPALAGFLPDALWKSATARLPSRTR